MADRYPAVEDFDEGEMTDGFWFTPFSSQPLGEMARDEALIYDTHPNER